jgi:hypothetical protein
MRGVNERLQPEAWQMQEPETLSASLVTALEMLRPGEGSTQAELDRAMRDIRTAVDAGQAMDHFQRVLCIDSQSLVSRPTTLDVLRQSIKGPFIPRPAQPMPAPAARGRTVVSIRSVPAAGTDPFAPSWSQGMRPTNSSGPFLDQAGQRFWIDSFVLQPGLAIEVIGASGVSRILVQLPWESALVGGSSRSLRNGSVWISAQSLASDRLADEFIGLRIQSGTVRITGAAQKHGSTLTLRDDWSVQLELVLEQPPTAPMRVNFGADAAQADIELPPKVHITLTAARPPTIELDEFHARAYGSVVRFRRTETVPFFDAISRSLIIPCETAPTTFSFSQKRGVTFQITGTAPIVRGGWALPVTVTSRDALGEADGAGAAWLELNSRLEMQWRGLPQKVKPKATTMLMAPNAISVFATVLEGDVRHSLQLWDDKRATTQRRCTVEVASTSGSVVLHVSKPGTEIILFGGTAKPRLDRPLQSDGGRLSANFSTGWLFIASSEKATTATVLALEPTAASAPHISFAIENALLKTRPPMWLYAFGNMQDDHLDSGLLLLRFPLRALLPTLPDPYATNFDLPRMDVDTGWTTANVLWSNPSAPILGFSLQNFESFSSSLLSNTVGALRGKASRRGIAACLLLDVSSNADQFGIAVPIEQSKIDGLSVVVPAGEAPVITLPPISWEPMLTKAPASTSGDIALPPPPHDGGVAGFLAERDDLRVATPVSLLSAHFAAMRDNKHFLARLPLPFGLIANLRTRDELPAAEGSQFIARGGSIYMNRPVFPGGLTGARQLGLRGAPRLPESETPGGFVDATLPGHVEFVDDYAQAVLSTNLHTQFDQEFGPSSTMKSGIEPRIPLRHYELSGYGASLFSDWRNTKAVGPAIIQARFDVMMGRTAHEVIQMQSVLYPWFVRVTRSIIIDRTAGGWILREDTGWVAASDGLFAYQPVPADAFPPERRHLGAISGIERVRNIRLEGPQFPLPVQGGALALNWQPVRFDADIIFRTDAAPRLAVAQGSALGRVPSREISGWIQIGGPPYTDMANGIPISLTRPATATGIFNLLQVAGPARAPVGCILNLGGTDTEPGMVFRTSSVDVECNDNALDPNLVVAVRGSPILPRDGAWSLARMAAAEPAPKSLDPSFPIPLIRPNGSPAADRWHLGDPADILKLGDTDNPTTRYGFVQALGAQKLFFGRVRVGNDADPVSVPQAPQLADMGALLHAAGIFPGLADAFDLPNLRNLSVKNGSLGFKETFDIAVGREAVLVDVAGDNAIQVVIEYHNENGLPTRATIEVDPQAAPRWRLSLTRVCFAVRYKKSKLISLFASVLADELSAPTVKDLCVHYEGILDALQVIFSNVQQVARFLPGGADAGLKVGFSQGRLAVHNAFALPNLPLGAGQITDVAVEMGFDVALSPFAFRFIAGLGSSAKPFRWVVSPLAGTGCVQVGVGTDGLDVLVQGGLGLGLAIDLGIAAGSAAVALAMEISTSEDPFAVRGILSGRASVDVLQGLASATITLAAGLGFVPPPELGGPPFVPPQLLPPPDEIPELTVTLLASVSVGIHISVCWVVDVDWDGYWQFRQQITTPAIPIPV